MKSLLICITYNNVDKKGLEDIINTFAQWEYDIRILEIEPSNWLNYESLPSLVSSITAGTQKRRIVILANIQTALLSWYRCFNWLADDFIYFIDDSPAFTKTDNFDFYKTLASLVGIDKDPVQGRIYLNLSADNYKKIFPYLCVNGNSQYFDDLNNFAPYPQTAPNEVKLKNYIYNGLEYIFNFDVPSFKKLKPLVVRLDAEIIAEDFLIDIQSAPFMIFYLILDITEKGIIDWSLNGSIYHYLMNFASEDFKKHFSAKIWNYLNTKTPGFYETIYLMSIEVILNPQDPQVLKNIMSVLLHDAQYPSYHYSIMINILFYISNCNLQTYPEFYLDQRKELNRLCTWHRSNLSIKMNQPQGIIRNIAIHVDQLLGLTHSPTKLMLDYAKNLTKVLPEARVKIFVEDNLYSHPQEVMVPYLFSSAESNICRPEHLRYLQGTHIEVFYADTEKAGLFRTQHIIAAINDFEPDLVLTNSCISLAMELIYDHFPIVYFSMGGTYFTCRADVYLVAWADEVLQNNQAYKLLDSALIESIKVGIDFPIPQQKKSRDDYGLTNSQFVMITVGNRLHADMNEAFITEIGNFLINHDDAVWFLVGFVPYSEFVAKYAGLIDSHKIVILSYEYDLMALYDLCDVFVNPIRYGGGNSVAWAMSRKLPVLQLNIPSAGLYFIGPDNTIGPSLEAYGNELLRLCEDVHYRQEFRDKMYDRIQAFNMDASVSALTGFMALARQRYEKRVQKKVTGGEIL